MISTNPRSPIYRSRFPRITSMPVINLRKISQLRNFSEICQPMKISLVWAIHRRIFSDFSEEFSVIFPKNLPRGPVLKISPNSKRKIMPSTYLGEVPKNRLGNEIRHDFFPKKVKIFPHEFQPNNFFLKLINFFQA